MKPPGNSQIFLKFQLSPLFLLWQILNINLPPQNEVINNKKNMKQILVLLLHGETCIDCKNC